MTHPSIQTAAYVLEGIPLKKEDALLLKDLQGEDLLDLISLANKVKNRFAPQNHICTISNARSGACSENCRYCAQSAHYEAQIEVYPLITSKQILDEARVSYENGIRNFGIVTSGQGFRKNDADFSRILETIDTLYQTFPDIHICASLGILSEETAKALSEHKIRHYNHNLQVNPKNYATYVANTHSIEDRITTIRLIRKNGIQACAGGIIGLGESVEDRIKLAYTLSDLGVEVIPLNVLIPIKRTPLENQAVVSAFDVLKTFAIFRLILPNRTIKFAAGRETRMKDWQALVMLAGANGMLTGGYLTTRGRETSEDETLLKNLEDFRAI